MILHLGLQFQFNIAHTAFPAIKRLTIFSFFPRWIPGVIFYLASDALFLGLMATALCLSFFPEGLLRIALLTLLFPLLSLALCAWMTVFGFYLRWVQHKKNKIKIDFFCLQSRTRKILMGKYFVSTLRLKIQQGTQLLDF